MGVCSPHCCGFYSASGVIFMLFVWMMLTFQPFYVSGIEDNEIARTNAFGAMITFGVTFVISAAMIMKGKRSGPEYETANEDLNRLNIDLKNNYGSMAAVTDSY